MQGKTICLSFSDVWILKFNFEAAIDCGCTFESLKCKVN